jgi:putative Holliday junction resolvase
MRWIALDVGARRVGVAVGSAPDGPATALPALPFTDAPGVSERVADLVRTWEATGVVVGIPYTSAGEGRGARRAWSVVSALRAALSVRVEVADERGTTAAAERLLAEAGVPRRRWRDLVDGVAARLILEGYLASQHERSDPARR